MPYSGAEWARGLARLPQITPDITLPTLVLQGEADKLVKPEGA